MEDRKSRGGCYVLAVIVGAIGGGLFVALATDAIPKMVSQIGEHVPDIMARIEESGFDLPAT
jgi:hypothetical protein